MVGMKGIAPSRLTPSQGVPSAIRAKPHTHKMVSEEGFTPSIEFLFGLSYLAHTRNRNSAESSLRLTIFATHP